MLLECRHNTVTVTTCLQQNKYQNMSTTNHVFSARICLQQDISHNTFTRYLVLSCPSTRYPVSIRLQRGVLSQHVYKNWSDRNMLTTWLGPNRDIAIRLQKDISPQHVCDKISVTICPQRDIVLDNNRVCDNMSAIWYTTSNRYGVDLTDLRSAKTD